MHYVWSTPGWTTEYYFVQDPILYINVMLNGIQWQRVPAQFLTCNEAIESDLPSVKLHKHKPCIYIFSS